ncbi:kinase 6 [Balamuthia mandrillaris]
MAQYKVAVLGEKEGKSTFVTQFLRIGTPDAERSSPPYSKMNEPSNKKMLWRDGKAHLLEVENVASGTSFISSLCNALLKAADGFILYYNVDSSPNEALAFMEQQRAQILRMKGSSSASPSALSASSEGLSGERRRGTTTPTPLVLVCNCDNVQRRKVEKERGQALASSWGVPFFEVSPKLSMNIEEPFEALLGLMMAATATPDTNVDNDYQDAPRTKQPQLQRTKNEVPTTTATPKKKSSRGESATTEAKLKRGFGLKGSGFYLFGRKKHKEKVKDVKEGEESEKEKETEGTATLQKEDSQRQHSPSPPVSPRSSDEQTTDDSISHECHQEVATTLTRLGLAEYIPLFAREAIDMAILRKLSEEDLEKLGVKTMGHRKKLLYYLQESKADITAEARTVEKSSVATFSSKIDASNLVYKDKLGGGAFGDVYRGVYRGTTDVAIKTLHSLSHNAVIAEAQIMDRLPNHPNVVTFYGVALKDNQTVCIVTEFIEGGALDHFLRVNSFRLEVRNLVEMAKQVAAGMDHLHSHHIIHRDLAARNLLVDKKGSNKYTVKVCDFGLSRSVAEGDYYEINSKFPLKWSAPEVFKWRKYSSKSDVWSFAVTLWEIFSLGQLPYAELSNRETVKEIEAGYRLPCPTRCPPPIYNLMLRCWDEDAKQRPNFQDIYSVLAQVQRQEEEAEGEDKGEEQLTEEDIHLFCYSGTQPAMYSED